MIENARLSILIGGHHHCTPEWSRDREKGQSADFISCFAFWMPTKGGVTLETTEGEFRVKPGSLYFIPAQHLIRQTCEKEMFVYWIAFVSESFYLHHRLAGIRKVHRWPVESMIWVKEVFERFEEFFEDVEHLSRPHGDAPASLAIMVEAALMYLTARLIGDTDADFRWGDYAGLERLKPAIDFMDAQYLSNPSLAEIAERIRMAPIYFQRFFKRQTGLTPFKYMENRRLDLARKLLFDQRLSIKEVSNRAGYPNPFYFSRAFRKHFGLAPSRLRQVP